MTTLLALATIAFQGPALRDASTDVDVVVDDARLADVAHIHENRVQVPMRPIFERLGAFVQWYPENKKVVATKDGRTIELVIGQAFAYDLHPTLLDYPPRIVAGRVMVPLRFVTESLGGSVRWDPEERVAYVNSTAE